MNPGRRRMTAGTRWRARWQRVRRAQPVLILAAAVVVGSIVTLVFDTQEAQTGQVVAEQQRDDTAEQALDAADPVLDLCDDATPVGEALRADPGDPCELAAQVVAAPVPAVAARDGRDAPPPTPAQIQAAVRAELARNPPADGRSPTAGEVAAVVAQILTANPPAGVPPTPEQIEAAVARYFAENPPRDGVDGASGAPGRPPTAEEIQAAVAAELAANPPRMGDRGVQGVGVQDVRAEQRDTGCVLVFTLADPADGATAERAVPVPDGICADGGLLG